MCRKYTLKYSVETGIIPVLSGPGKKKKVLATPCKFVIASKKGFKLSVCKAHFEIQYRNTKF